jgi:fused signal recognition particle receptor
MFNFGKKDSKSDKPDHKARSTPSFAQRLQAGLGKTRQALFGDIRNLFGDGGTLDEVMDELEMRLITADAGIEATDEISWTNWRCG